MRKQQPESVYVLNPCRDYLRLQGFYVIRNYQGLGCHPGLADLTAHKDGITLYIECKYGKGKQSSDQILFESHVAEKGIPYLVIYSVEELAAVIKKMNLESQAVLF